MSALCANLVWTDLDILQHEQEWMLAELRRARYGYLLALHVLLLCAAGRAPTETATFLLCALSSVYRIVNTYTAQGHAALCDAPARSVGQAVGADTLAAPQLGGSKVGWAKAKRCPPIKAMTPNSGMERDAHFIRAPHAGR